jgi:hypothetical protein
MKNKIATGGLGRLTRARNDLPAFDQIERKYAARLAAASPSEKAKIREQMAGELLRVEKMKGHKPSPATLW